MSFFDNTRKPAGLGGRLMVSMMNVGHRALADWGLGFLPLAPDARVLDCGCGGGANMKKLLKKCPQGIVKGVDYSPISVGKARRLNAEAIGEGRALVWQGSVEQMIFAEGWFDAATAFETVYFWPDPVQGFKKIYRVLKPGGTFLICNECSGGSVWEDKIDGMRAYNDSELKEMLEGAGFCGIQIHKKEKGWLCVTARK